MLLWGDTIHAAEVQFDHPEITIEYDVDPAQAAKSRAELLEYASSSGIIVGSDHISFPGIGHVAKSGTAYRWIPLRYSGGIAELDPKN